MKLEAVSKQSFRARPSWVLAFVPLVALAIIQPKSIPLDDAYITLHNARVLLSGQPDPVYGASYLAGATSLFHLAIVAAVTSVANPLYGSMAVSLFGALVYLFGISKLADRMGLDGWRKAAVLILAVFAGKSTWFYINGLETSLGMAAAAWMLVWCDDKRKLPALVGLAPFVRPELLLLSVFLGLRLLIRAKLTKRQTFIVALIAIGCAAPWVIWSATEVGQPIPSTIGAKLAFYRPPPITFTPEGLYLRLLVMLQALVNTNQIPLLLGFAGLSKVRGGLAAGAFVVVGWAVAFAIMPDIAIWNGGRYSAIYFPVLIAGLLAIGSERTRLSDAVVLAVVAWTLLLEAVPTYERAFLWTQQPLDRHTEYVARLPASSVVLIHDAGQVAWASPQAKLVDVVGLKTPEVIPIHQRYTVEGCKRSKALDTIAQRFRATHVVVLEAYPWPCIADNLREAGWTLRPINRSTKFVVYELKR